METEGNGLGEGIGGPQEPKKRQPQPSQGDAVGQVRGVLPGTGRDQYCTRSIPSVAR